MDDPSPASPDGSALRELTNHSDPLVPAVAAVAGAAVLASCLSEDLGDSRQGLLSGVDAKDDFAGIRGHVPMDPPALGEHVVLFSRGRAAAGDGGEGLFFWDYRPAADSAPEDDLTNLVPRPSNPPPSGRWKRDGTDSIVSGTTVRHAAVINVRWFGAKGDGDTVDTAAIQAALDEVREKGGTLFFPPGRYAIDETLDAGKSIGVRYQGGSGSPDNQPFASDGTTPRSPTALIWTASQPGTLFRWSGQDCVFDGLAFHGRLTGNSTRATIGFHLDKQAGIGTGKAWFPSIHIVDCDVAFQCGANASDGNCDVLTFGRLSVASCGSGFRVVNDQGQNYVFLSTRFENVGTGFDFIRGGMLHVARMTAINTPVLLNVERGGNGASGYRFGFVRLGPQTQRVVWVKHNPDVASSPDLDVAHVTIDGADARGVTNQGTPPGVAAFQLRGRAVLTVRNVNGGLTAGNQPLFSLGGIDDANPKTTLAVFENCNLDDLDPDTTAIGSLADSFGAKRWQLRECYRGTAGQLRVAEIGNLHAVRSGTGTIPKNSSSVVLTHKVFGGGSLSDNVIPRVSVTPRGATLIWVSSVTQTTFTVNRAGGGGALSFDWTAEVVQ